MANIHKSKPTYSIFGKQPPLELLAVMGFLALSRNLTERAPVGLRVRSSESAKMAELEMQRVDEDPGMAWL